MSIADALSRINQIQTQLIDLSGASAPAAAPTGGVAAPSSGTGTASFAGALAQAQSPAASIGSAQTVGTTAAPYGTTAGPYGGAADAYGAMQAPYYASYGGLGATGVAAAGSSLPPAARSMLTAGQQQFASRLAADTGLDPHTISAWLLAEENGSAATAREQARNNDWLNIGYTDSGTYGSSDSVWSDPTAAADATAGWLKGQNTISGYGTASSGIQAILQTAGQSPQAQVAAIQSSGWASSGYPDLPALLAQVGG